MIGPITLVKGGDLVEEGNGAGWAVLRQSGLPATVAGARSAALRLLSDDGPLDEVSFQVASETGALTDLVVKLTGTLDGVTWADVSGATQSAAGVKLAVDVRGYHMVRAEVSVVSSVASSTFAVTIVGTRV